jgi:AcrR family transcriptional regulator
MPGAGPTGRSLRADARRNREMITAAAEDLFLRDGASASLEEIARRAGVGSATLHRHFPTRKNLLETVYFNHVKELCDAAESLAADHDPAEALIAWLRLINARATVNNGLAAAMAADQDGRASGDQDGRASGSLQSCHAMVAAAGAALLGRAIGSGAVRPDVDIRDLLGLVNALARAGGGHAGTSGDDDRLLMLALTGIMTRPKRALQDLDLRRNVLVPGEDQEAGLVQRRVVPRLI